MGLRREERLYNQRPELGVWGTVQGQPLLRDSTLLSLRQLQLPRWLSHCTISLLLYQIKMSKDYVFALPPPRISHFVKVLCSLDILPPPPLWFHLVNFEKKDHQQQYCCKLKTFVLMYRPFTFLPSLNLREIYPKKTKGPLVFILQF